MLREFILRDQRLLNACFVINSEGLRYGIYIFSVLNFNCFVNKYRKYLKLVAGFTFNSFSLRLARNNIKMFCY